MKCLRITSEYWLETVRRHGGDFRLEWETFISG